MSSVEYKGIVKCSKVEVQCSYCEVKLLPKFYLVHLKALHKEKLTSANICIWCMEYTWRQRDPSVNNYEHRTKCLRYKNFCILLSYKIFIIFLINFSYFPYKYFIFLINFSLLRSRITPPPIEESVKIEELNAMDLNRYLNCDECDEWHRTTRNQGVFEPPHPNFPESFASEIPIADKWYDLSVDYEFASPIKRIKLNEDLKIEIASLDSLQMDPESGIDGFWIRLFLVKGQKYCWFHYSIRVEAWSKFYECASTNTELFCVMPYWCLCNGGQPLNFDFHHRHCIVLMERVSVGKFKKLMRTDVTFMDGSLTKMCMNKKMDTKYHKEIIGIKHFMNTWRYVSSPQSMCLDKKIATEGVNQANNESTFHGAKVRKLGGKRGGKCHYFIGKPMIPHCLLGMALYFPNGFQVNFFFGFQVKFFFGFSLNFWFFFAGGHRNPQDEHEFSSRKEPNTHQ